MSLPSDLSLMHAAANGDWTAFEQLVERYQAEAWRMAYRLVSDRHAAEDLAQEAFLRVFQARERYRPSASFRTYLARIVVRLCLDYLRKGRPAPAGDSLHPADPSASPASQAEESERVRAIGRAVAGLPPKQRAAVVLRYYQGLSGRESATAMGTSVKAVERLLARGRAALFEQLGRFLP